MSLHDTDVMRKRKLHVAVVDDDESVRKALERLLAGYFTKVETYASAERFLSSLNWATPDCLILDLQMPDVSGLELQHRMNASEIHVPVVVITALHDPDLRSRCEAAGARAFLSKPLTYNVLVDAINKATQREPSQTGT